MLGRSCSVTATLTLRTCTRCSLANSTLRSPNSSKASSFAVPSRCTVPLARFSTVRRGTVQAQIGATSQRSAKRWLSASPASRGLTPFLLADIGEGITECELVQWFVKPGDEVLEFDKICEVQSDKASVEITSRFAGVIKKLHYKVGDMAKVGQPLVDIESAGAGGGGGGGGSDTSSAGEDAKQESVIINEIREGPSPDPSVKEGVAIVAGDEAYENEMATLATPAVRRVARENGVDLKSIRGSGKGGRILKEDVLSRAKAGGAVKNGSVVSSASAPVSRPSAEATKRPLNGHQRAMFKQMTKSLSIPHFGYSDEIELDALTRLRASLNKRLASSAANDSVFASRFPHLSKSKKISYMPLFVKSLSLALNSFPILNAQLINPDDDPATASILYRSSHNVGIAMDTAVGLLVPSIKDVQAKSVLEVAEELARLQAVAVKGAIAPADLTGGTISLSNIGTVGGTNLSPVVVSTELCIAALGRMRRLPRFETVTLENGSEQERIVAKQIVNVSWSADHRVVDGATIARFNELWRSYIEEPSLMLSELR